MPDPRAAETIAGAIALYQIATPVCTIARALGITEAEVRAIIRDHQRQEGRDERYTG